MLWYTEHLLTFSFFLFGLTGLVVLVVSDSALRTRGDNRRRGTGDSLEVLAVNMRLLLGEDLIFIDLFFGGDLLFIDLVFGRGFLVIFLASIVASSSSSGVNFYLSTFLDLLALSSFASSPLPLLAASSSSVSPSEDTWSWVPLVATVGISAILSVSSSVVSLVSVELCTSFTAFRCAQICNIDSQAAATRINKRIKMHAGNEQ